jgi:hypothetical protein
MRPSYIRVAVLVPPLAGSCTPRQFSDPTGSSRYQRGQIHTAKAVIDPQSHYPANRLWFQEETTNGLP